MGPYAFFTSLDLHKSPAAFVQQCFFQRPLYVPDFTTTKRLAAMQLCPLFIRRPLTLFPRLFPYLHLPVSHRHHCHPVPRHIFSSVAACGLGHFAARIGAAGKGHSGYSGCTYQLGFPEVAGYQQCLKYAFGCACIYNYFFYSQCAPTHVRRMFQQHDVTRHYSRRQSAIRLPVREIPRHDSQYDTQRPERHIALVGICFYHLVSKKVPHHSLHNIPASRHTSLLRPCPAVVGFPISCMASCTSMSFSAALPRLHA